MTSHNIRDTEKNPEAEVIPIVYIRFKGELKREVVQELKASLNEQGFPAPDVERVDGNYDSNVRYFYEEGRKLVEQRPKVGGPGDAGAKRLRAAAGACFSPLVAGASGGARLMRAQRVLSVWSPPNRGMHPTADTRAVVNVGRAAGDAWRYAASSSMRGRRLIC